MYNRMKDLKLMERKQSSSCCVGDTQLKREREEDEEVSYCEYFCCLYLLQCARKFCSQS